MLLILDFICFSRPDMSLPLQALLWSVSVETTRCCFMDALLVAEVLPLNYTRMLF
jgi:hypothetical protein